MIAPNPLPRPGERRQFIDEIDRLVRAEAARSFLLPMACKERALVGHHLLRARGLPASLVVGVQHYPFLAHAWVECDGLTVTDDREHCAQFEPVVRYP